MRFSNSIEAYYWAITHKNDPKAILIRKEAMKICDKHQYCPNNKVMYCPYEIGEEMEDLSRNPKGCLNELGNILKKLGYINDL